MALASRSKGRADSIPLSRKEERSLYREIFRCWDIMATLKGQRDIARIDLRAARRELKRRGNQQGVLSFGGGE